MPGAKPWRRARSPRLALDLLGLGGERVEVRGSCAAKDVAAPNRPVNTVPDRTKTEQLTDMHRIVARP